MPMDLTCPQCDYVFPVADTAHPVGVDCLRCGTGLTVVFKPVDRPLPGEPPYELVVSRGRPSADTLDDPFPAHKPARGRERADAADAADLRSRAKAQGSGMAVVVLAAGTALLATCGGLGLLGYYLFSEQALDTASVRPSKTVPPVGGGYPGYTSSPGLPKRPLDRLRGTNNPPPPFTPPVRPNPGPGWSPPPDPVPPSPPVKKDTFTLQPLVPTLPSFGPSQLGPDGTRQVMLPGKVGELGVAAGGRYLVLHFPNEGRLATFDVVAGRIVHQTDASPGRCLLTAGVTLAVLSTPNRRLHLYAVPELTPIGEADSALFHGPRAIAMGFRTDGPLFLVDPFGEVVLQDLSRPNAPEIEGSRAKPGVHAGLARAAANGRYFTTFDGFAENHRVIIATERQRRWEVTKDSGPTPFPTPDGRLFLGRGGAVDQQGNAVHLGVINNQTWLVPATSGLHYLKIAPVTTGPGPFAKKTLKVSVHFGYTAGSADRPFPNTLTFDDLPADGLFDPFGNPEPLDQRFILVPEARVLLMIPGTKDQVIIRKFVKN